MASLTRSTIMDAFLRLLDERPVNKISVKDIVEECGINRNTFYYHFSDIPELVEEIVKSKADAIVGEGTGISSLEECVEAAMRHCKEHRRAIWHIYNSANRDIYERYLMDICDHVVVNFIDNTLAGRKIPEADRAAIVQGYKCEVFGFVTDWLNRGMTDDIEAVFLRLCVLRKGFTEEMFSRSMADGGF